ncbi:MAG: hypothetical protein AB4911_02885 [Oscillochloridaceae bacterium umkhey_bin13]
MDEGRYTIPTRIYLNGQQRVKLLHLLEQHELELDHWLSQLVDRELANHPDPPDLPTDDQSTARAHEILRRRAELRRLRPRLVDPHNPAPAWLRQLAADLEAEIARLERE